MSQNLLSSQDLLPVLRSGISLLDVRSEVEFAKGSLPSSVNLPLLRSEERAEVGLCYRIHGQSAAVRLGHQLVRDEVRVERVNSWVALLNTLPFRVLYCARGGLRSQIAQSWLSEFGLVAQRVSGGYKEIRRELLSLMGRAASVAEPIVLTGKTGSGKTDFLHAQRTLPFIDLEHLANHCGSAFGAIYGSQPSQATFENRLAVELIKLWDTSSHFLLEDESRCIGQIQIPDTLFGKLSRAPLLVLESPLELRIHNIRRQYIDNLLLGQERKACTDPFSELERFLLHALFRIRKSLGGARHEALMTQIRESIASHRTTGESAVHQTWIKKLLLDYYDPYYERHLARCSSRIVFRGGSDQLLEELPKLRRYSALTGSSQVA